MTPLLNSTLVRIHRANDCGTSLRDLARANGVGYYRLANELRAWRKKNGRKKSTGLYTSFKKSFAKHKYLDSTWHTHDDLFVKNRTEKK